MEEAFSIGESQIEVVLHKDGDEHRRSFPAHKTVSETVSEVGRELGVGSVLVKDAQGNSIRPQDGSKTLGEVGRLNLYPKTQGA